MQKEQGNLTFQDIQAIKLIFSKLQNNINIRQLAYHIREHVIQANDQTISKKNILQFFLKCESRLINPTDNGWKSVFETNIAKLNSVLKIRSIQEKVLRRLGLDGLKGKNNIIHLTQENLQQIQTSLTEYVEYENIEVEEEVRLKTTSFFKWCRYVAVSKQIKEKKSQEIDKIQKSKYFNIYALKFNAFALWKRYNKHKKIEYSKFINLKMKNQKRYFTETINIFYQKYQINSIEEALVKIVSNKLNIIQKNKFFKLFRCNLLEGKKNIETLNLYPNIWCYRFLKLITENQSQVKQKSSLVLKNYSQNNYQLLCTKQSLAILKKMVLNFKMKIKNIQNVRRRINLNLFLKLEKATKAKSENLLELKKYLKKKRSFYIFSMFSTYNFQKTDQNNVLFNLNQELKLSYLRKFFKRAKKQIQSNKCSRIKIFSAQKQILKLKLNIFFKRIALIIKSSLNKSIKNQQFKNIRRLSLFKIWSINRKNKKILNQDIKTIQMKINLELMKKSFKGMTLSPSFQLIQENLLMRAGQIYNKIVKRIGMLKIKQKKTQNLKLIQLCSLSQKIIEHYVFYKMFMGSIKIYKRINQISAKRMSNLKLYLLSTLKKIQNSSFTKQMMVKQSLIKFKKVMMIQSLKKRLKITKNMQQVQKNNNSFNLKNTLKVIRLQKNRKNFWLKNTFVLNGKYFLKKIVEYLNNQQNKKQQIIQKSQNLFNILIRYKFKNLIRNISRFYTQVINLNQRSMSLQLNILSTKFQRLKNGLHKQTNFNQQNFERKRRQIKKLFVNSLYYQLSYNNKKQKIKSFTQKNLKSLFIFQLMIMGRITIKKRLLKKKMSLIKIQKNIKNCKQYKCNIKIKQDQKFILLNQSLRKRKSDERINALKLMKQKLERNKKQNLIKQRLLKQKFIILVRNFYFMHSQVIKKKVAIMHYARNLKKKILNKLAVNCIEYSQKQNRQEVSGKNTLVKIQKILEKSRRSDNIIEKINRFNMSKSRQVCR